MLVDHEIGLDQRPGQFTRLVIKGARSRRAILPIDDKVRSHVHSPTARRRRKSGNMRHFREGRIEIVVETDQVERRKVANCDLGETKTLYLRLRQNIERPGKLPGQEVSGMCPDARVPGGQKLMQ